MLGAYETEMKDKAAAADKQHIRKDKSLTLLKPFKTWLDKSALHVPPKSAIGKTNAYSLRQWPKLTHYIENVHLNINNNRAERAIVTFVIARKNWMLSNTAKGAQANAILYSVIETAKENGLMPFDYLLPWNVKLT